MKSMFLHKLIIIKTITIQYVRIKGQIIPLDPAHLVIQFVHNFADKTPKPHRDYPMYITQLTILKLTLNLSRC